MEIFHPTFSSIWENVFDNIFGEAAKLPEQNITRALFSYWSRYKVIKATNKGALYFDLPLNQANVALYPFAFELDMYVGTGAANGFVIDRIVGAKNLRTQAWKNGGSTTQTLNGITVNASTGLITVTDATQLGTAGDLNMTLVVSDLGEIPVVIHKVDGSQSVGFVDSVSGNDANNGKQPHLAKATPDWSGMGNPAVRCYKRGGAWITGVYSPGSNSITRAYGDKTLARPILDTGDNGSFAINCAEAINITIQDIDIRGGYRTVYGYGANNLKVYRNRLGNNYYKYNSNCGVYTKGCIGLYVYHNEFINLVGDGVYGTNTSDAEIDYNYFDAPVAAYQSDPIQFTSELKAGSECYRIKARHNICMQAKDTNVTKGDMVFQGVYGYEIYGNACLGKYFGLGLEGFWCSVFDNYIFDCFLPSTSGNRSNTWGIGAGSQFPSNTHAYFLNIVNGATKSGIGVSGWGSPAGGWQRFDYRIMYNNIISVSNAAVRLTEPLSGYITDNNFTACGSGVQRAGNGQNIASDPAQMYNFLTIQNNTSQSTLPDIGNLDMTLSGTCATGSTISLNIANAPVGMVFTPYWLLESFPVSGETGNSFTIPANLDMTAKDKFRSTSSNARNLCCGVKCTDSSGRIVFLPAYWNKGEVCREVIGPAVNTKAPLVVGAPVVGETLTVVNNGTWTGGVDSYTYQWQDNGTNISGATAASYIFASGNTNVKCVVTAVNIGGTRTVSSNSIYNTGNIDGIVAGAVFDIAADNAASYSGSGQVWANLVAAPADGTTTIANDFWLGNDSVASANDPTFVGTPGDAGAYFLLDGGDFASCKASHLTRGLYKDTNLDPWWAICLIDLVLPTSSASHLWGNTNWAGLRGCRVRITSTGILQLGLATGAADVLGTLHTSVTAGKKLHVLNFTNGTRAWKSALNSSTFGTNTIGTSNSQTGDNNTSISFGAGYGIDPLPNGNKLIRFAMGKGSLDNAALARIVSYFNARYGLGIS